MTHEQRVKYAAILRREGWRSAIENGVLWIPNYSCKNAEQIRLMQELALKMQQHGFLESRRFSVYDGRLVYRETI